MENTKILHYLPIAKIHPHPNNPRKDLGDLSELAESIKVSGIMQNLTVVPHSDIPGEYTVIIGYRRLGASKLAGVEVVPCVVVEMSEKEQLATMMLENMQRSDLTYYEQAEGFQLMIDLGDTVDSISEKTGLSKATVKNRIKIAKYDCDIMREAALRQPTMEQYMRLCEIEDVERANDVARFLGTKKFDYEVDKALTQQKTKKQRDELFALISTVATKYDGDISEAVREKKITCLEHFYTPLTDDARVKIKELAEKYQPLYYNEGYGFGIFRDYNASDDERKSELELNRAKRTALENKADELYTRMLARAVDFIYSYKSKKEHFDVLLLHLITGIVDGSLHVDYHKYDLAKALGYVLPEGASTWDEKHGMESWIIDSFEKDKPRAMLMLLWKCTHEERPFTLLYRDTKLTLRDRNGWHRIFNFLTDIGYNVSDEEWNLINGSHPIFSEEVPI